jgi:hypothetical protein
MIEKTIIAIAFPAALVLAIVGFARFIKHMIRAHKNVSPGFNPWHQYPRAAMMFLGWFWLLPFKKGLTDTGMKERQDALKALQLLAFSVLLTLLVTTLSR